MKFDGDRIVAENFDGLALISDIERNLGYPIRGRRVLLLGAGGAARGAVLPFLEQEPRCSTSRIARWRRRRRSASSSGTQRNLGTGGYSDFAGQQFDIVVNATSASLRGELPQIRPAAFAQGCLAYDMVYGKGLTPPSCASRATRARGGSRTASAC